MATALSLLLMLAVALGSTALQLWLTPLLVTFYEEAAPFLLIYSLHQLFAIVLSAAFLFAGCLTRHRLSARGWLILTAPLLLSGGATVGVAWLIRPGLFQIRLFYRSFFVYAAMLFGRKYSAEKTDLAEYTSFGSKTVS